MISSGSQVPAAAPAMNPAGGTWQHARMTCRSSPGAARPGSARRRDARRCPPGGVLAGGRQLRRHGRLTRPERLHAGFQLAVTTPSACLRSCTALLARREARSCQECRADSRHGRGQDPARNAGLTPGTGEGRRSPASCRSGKQTMIVLTTRPANSTAQVGAHAYDIAARHPSPALIIGTCFRACWSLLGDGHP